MKKKISLGLLLSFILIGISGVSSASLTKIGVAEYNSAYYAMIYDNDIQLAWLDYTNGYGLRGNQKSWAASISAPGILTYYWFSGYENFIWTADNWRLSEGSEMGHLFATELNLAGSVTTAVLNASEFNNLIASRYYTNTYGAPYNLSDGSVGYADLGGFPEEYHSYNGIAVRSGEFSPVPVPGTIWLLGAGLIGILSLKKEHKSGIQA